MGCQGQCRAQRGCLPLLFNQQEEVTRVYAFLFSQQAEVTSLSDRWRDYQLLLLTSCAALAQLPNLSDSQFLHLECGVPPYSMK